MRAEVCNGIFSFLNLAIKKIEKDENIDQKFLWYLSVSELMNYLKNKVLPAKNELRERRKFSVWIFKDPYVGKIYTGDSAREFLLKNTIKEKHDIKNSSEIKGNVAYPGKVNGKVKIVNSVKEMVKMKRGDIMVSVQTMPELLPAMKKAVAFVTDMGGITSHAAIVSREMKVPCIVGTRSATKILKDGDRVEVDANIGIVKKI